MMKRDNILNNILKECYWDYNICRNDLEKVLINNDKREIQKLFSKITYNSKDKLLALSLFTLEQLKEQFSIFKVTYNEKYITKHFLVLKALLLNEQINIKGLEWKKI